MNRVRWYEELSYYDAIDIAETSHQRNIPQSEPEAAASSADAGYECTILDVLNTDCWKVILDYLPIGEVVRSERVSQGWQAMIQEYLSGVRSFFLKERTLYPHKDWNNHVRHYPYRLISIALSDLTCMLKKMGPYMVCVTALSTESWMRSIADYCPNLEDITLVRFDENTGGIKLLAENCKKLKRISFEFCLQLREDFLCQFFSKTNTIQDLSIYYGSGITGAFFAKFGSTKLSTLSLNEMPQLNISNLASIASKNLSCLTKLELNKCSNQIILHIHSFLDKLVMLEELSLSGYWSVGNEVGEGGHLVESIGKLVNLKHLRLANNIFVNDELLEAVGRSCSRLRSLDISYCNPRRLAEKSGVTDRGVEAVSRGCAELATLTAITADISDGAFLSCVRNCHTLKKLIIPGCQLVTDELVASTVRALESHPRTLEIWVDGTRISPCNPAHHRCLILRSSHCIVSKSISNQNEIF